MTEEIKNQQAQDYDASQIQVLEGLEAVRMRPGMYIGSTSKEGLHHLVWEIVDNSIDEALAGFASHIQVFIEPDDSITVVDDGRGIPVDIQEKTGRPAVETVFTVLHAGGKFGGGGYKVSGGLHGVGSSVVNALSTQLDVHVHKNGKIHYQEYRRGHVVADLEVVGDTDKTGTTVHFTPDPEIFTETTTFDFDKLNYYLANSYLTDVISNEETKNKILGLAHIYKMDPQDMSKAIEKSVEITNGASEINIKVLTDYIVQLNVNVRKQEVPTLERMVNKNLANIEEEKLTEEELFIKEVDNTNFITFLNKQKGIVVSNIDAKNIGELQSKYNFPTGVLNILLEYSINQTGNNSIPHINYIDKIASSWSAQKLLGAKDAIDFVRNNRNYKKNIDTSNKKMSKQQKSYSNNKKGNYAPFPEYLQNRQSNFNVTKKKEDRVVTKEDEDAYNKMMQELNNKRDM